MSDKIKKYLIVAVKHGDRDSLYHINDIVEASNKNDAYKHWKKDRLNWYVLNIIELDEE